MKIIQLITLLLVVALNASAEDNPYADLKWQAGPNNQSIDGKATLSVPKDYYYLDEAETKKYSELNHNPSSGKDSLFTNGVWEAYFDFESTGYVKDDEKIDPDNLLNQYKEGVKAGNDLRREKGWSTLEVEGWFFKPQYDKDKQLLEWAFLLKDSESQKPVVNYYTRVLGRTGVMSIVLVTSPEKMNDAIIDFKSKLGGFEFNAGEKYSEFKQGDRIAEFGLGALILGGAAAIATKKGLWAVIGSFFAAFWKLVVLFFVGVVAKLGAILDWFKSLFRKSEK